MACAAPAEATTRLWVRSVGQMRDLYVGPAQKEWLPMARLNPKRAIVAVIFVGAGAALVASGALRPGAFSLGPGLLGSASAPVLGAACLGVGAILFARAFTKRPGPAPLVPAHIAFSTKQNPLIEPPLLDRSTRAPRTTSAPPLGRSAARPASDDAEGHIQDLTRKINRAGVMLATGKLSSEGYAKYVEDLKRQRTALEAATMRRDLRKV